MSAGSAAGKSEPALLTNERSIRERPILMNASMVRATVAGTKTQTRRALKLQPPAATLSFCTHHHPDPRPHHWAFDGASLLNFAVPCPYGGPGDRLWVRETFARIDGQTQPWIETDYRATYQHGNRLGDTLGIKKRWTPAIHMPRHASRILLEVTDVRIERLRDITEADALAEGIIRAFDGFGLPDGSHYHNTDPRLSFLSLWEAINGEGSVMANPWVWAVSFRRLAC